MELLDELGAELAVPRLTSILEIALAPEVAPGTADVSFQPGDDPALRVEVHPTESADEVLERLTAVPCLADLEVSPAEDGGSVLTANFDLECQALEVGDEAGRASPIDSDP